MNKVSFNKEELESYIVTAMDKWEVPGLSITIVKDGETVISKGYGTCEVGKNIPVDENTLFALSCTTASFTAAALAILVAERKLSWNARLIDVLPGFRVASDLVTTHATVIDALANRTGLPLEPLLFFPHTNRSRKDIFDLMKYVEPAYDFRSQWGVDLLMNMAAGEIIPALTGVSWDDFIRDRLFEPIGMNDSITGPHLFGNNSNIVTPHDRYTGKATPVAHAQTSNVGPALSIYSSASDMAKWLAFQLNNGKVGGRIIIPESEISMIRKSHVAANFKFTGISNNFLNQGLGLFISDGSMGQKLYSNGGDIDGMEAYHAFIPELDLGIAIMINSVIALPQRLVAWIIDRYTDAPYKDWVNDTLPAYDENIREHLLEYDRNQKNITEPSKKTSQSIEAYAGLYRHPLLGDLKVRLVGGTLSFSLGESYRGDFLHANHDTFSISMHTSYYSKMMLGGPAQFRLDQTGKVTSLFVAGREFQKDITKD